MALTGAAVGLAQELDQSRNEWYRHSVVNLHFDNHSRLFGRELTVEQIVDMLRPLRVTMIQVSARSGGGATYPTRVGVGVAGTDEYDTLAVWREVTRRLGVKFGIYMNTIGDKLVAQQNPGKWRRVDASGKASEDLCILPSPAGTGYLEQVHLPQVLEVLERYSPDSFWFDGDWSMQRPCYCEECVAAWRRETGMDKPPAGDQDPAWPRWLDLYQRRQDQYKKIVADAIHGARPTCLYTSNWSWLASHSDPRTAPDWADTLSADVGAGSSQGATRALRATVLFEQAQDTPYDMLPAIYPKPQRSLPRMLQECGLTLAGGAVVYLWLNNLDERQMLYGKTCVDFIRAREAICGPTQSASPTAVLISETSWAQQARGGRAGFWQRDAALNAALNLQEAHYAVDLVNEQTLRAKADQYTAVVVPGQRALGAEALTALKDIANRGGTVLFTGQALRPEDDSDPQEVTELLGLRRDKVEDNTRVMVELGQSLAPVCGRLFVTPGNAEVIARFSDDKPALTRQRLGTGQVAYLALAEVAYPDYHRLLALALRRLGVGPLVRVGEGGEEPWGFSLRRHGSELHLHMVDLGARVGGQRVDIDSTHATEANPQVAQLALALPLRGKIQSVRVVPETTQVRWEQAGEELRVTLTSVQDHAALIVTLAEEPSVPVASLSADTPLPVSTPHPVPKVLLADDFETDSGPLGSLKVDGVAITDETAATGRRSLRFTDGPNYAKPFYPYINPALPAVPLTGQVRVLLALKLDEAATVVVECRDREKSGPLVRFDGGGKVIVDGQQRASFPPGSWFTLELRLSLEEHWYEGAIIIPGQEPQPLGRLPYRTSEFRRPDRLYLVGEGTVKSVFYVDDVIVERIEAGAAQ